MEILKKLSGLVGFLLAGLALVMVGLIVLAWLAQNSVKADKSPGATVSITIGHWVLAGWQIVGVVGVLLMLAMAFIGGGIYAFRSAKTAT